MVNQDTPAGNPVNTRRPPLAQIDRWTRAHYRATYGETWGDGTFSAARAQFEEFAALVVRLRDALRDPFAPGNAEIIAEGDAWRAWAGEYSPQKGGCGAGIESMGRALEWGLRGAPAEELQRLEAERIAREERQAVCR